jgi:hypothetical protein
MQTKVIEKKLVVGLDEIPQCKNIRIQKRAPHCSDGAWVEQPRCWNMGFTI